MANSMAISMEFPIAIVKQLTKLIFTPPTIYWLIAFVFLALAVEIVSLLPLYLRSRRIKKRFGSLNSLHELRKLKPKEFEQFIADLYRRLGYMTEAVGASHDQGVDVKAIKDGKTYYIQCKKFITSKVGSPQLRDFVGALSHYAADTNGIFITTNVFTTEARKYAEPQPIVLIDGQDLLRLMESVNIERPNIESQVNKCPQCGGSLVERHGKFGVFIGCSNYPKCNYTINKLT